MTRAVKLFNTFAPDTSEGQWINFMKQQGISKQEIVATVRERTGYPGEHLELLVEHALGERPQQDIEFLLTPLKPTSIKKFERRPRGYLLKAEGPGDDSFYVLLESVGLDDEKVDRLLDSHQDELCFLAYKNAHEGSPFDTGLREDGHVVVAESGITFQDIQRLLAS